MFDDGHLPQLVALYPCSINYIMFKTVSIFLQYVYTTLELWITFLFNYILIYSEVLFTKWWIYSFYVHHAVYKNFIHYTEND